MKINLRLNVIDDKFIQGRPHFSFYNPCRIPIAVVLWLAIFLPTLAFAQSNPLERKITIQRTDITLAEAFDAIGKEGNCTFSYSNTLIDLDKRVHLRFSNTAIAEILQAILGEEMKAARVQGNQIFIRSSLGKGILEGHVYTSDGQPAAYVTVGIDGQRGTQANEKGYFTLRNIDIGKHTVTASYVGLQTKHQTVDVTDRETTDVSFTLNEDAQTLQEVVVNGARANAFANKETEYVARMPLSNLENAQVYNVINQELIKEQISVEIADVMRNAVGVVPQIHPSGGFGVNFRGFATGANARNGMETVSGRSSLDIANIERVEVLKGPSGTLFGSSISSFGGVVNLVTKKPYEVAQTEVSYTTGSFNLHRLTADINAPLKQDKSVLFRLNTAINRQKSFLTYGFNNTFIIAPSLTYKISERTTLNIDAEYFYTNNTRIVYNRYNPASGITNSRQIPLDYNEVLFFHDSDAETNSSKIYIDLRHKISDNWTSTSLFSFTGEDVDHSYQYYQTWISPTQVTRDVSNYGPISNNYLNVQQNLNGRFNTGFLKHNFLAGVNYRLNTGYRAQAATGVIDTADITTTIRPIVRKTIDNLIEVNPSSNSVPKVEVFSAYATDVVNFTDRLSTMLSLRVDHYVRATAGANEGDKQTAFAPKLGLLYQIFKDRLSVFGNYMSGFQNTASTVEQPDGTISNLDPLMAYQSEGGIKMESSNKRYNLTLSYYHISIDNATRVNPDGFTIQDGKQVSKGADIELIISPFAGLNMTAGYAYNDNRIVKANNPAIEGNKATGAPQNAVNVWLSYIFQGKLKGLGFGLGGNYVDKAFGFDDNIFYMPSYTLVNSTVFYQQHKWRLGFKLNNIGNEKYWSFNGAPQTPRNFAVNLSVKF